MDDEVAQFTGITGSSPEKAEQYLRISEGNLEHAIQLFFDSGGIDLQDQDAAATTTTSAPAPVSQPPLPPSLRPQQGTSSTRRNDDGVIQIDSDEEISDDNDPEITGYKRHGASRSRNAPLTGDSAPSSTQPPRGIEDDEAMARRMQEELYGSNPGGASADAIDPDGVRAPMARTTETLVGPDSNWGNDDPEQMRAAVAAQMQARRRRHDGRPGIFNQHPTTASVWEDNEEGSETRRQQFLARATGGASEASSKASLLAEMYRPPVELISRVPWDGARQQGKNEAKWILVNVQDPAVFDCQVLNRDIWKNPQIKETVKEHFIFMQYNKDDPLGNQYIQYYFQAKDSQDAYPHIAIVDPRTGEQVKVWSGPPVPKAIDFLTQLHEFLDRYSLKANAKNPVATRKSEKKASVDVNRMTEEEMMEMALQNSLANKSGPREEDPDTLTRNTGDGVKGKGKVRESADGEGMDVDQPSSPSDNLAAVNVTSPFTSISPSRPHTEPGADPATTTRIQFRHSGGRIIRRFSLSDPVRRLYEWLKAEPLEGKGGVEFELVCMGKNLMESLEDSVEQAGLKNQTVMIELLEEQT
ncbi:MAG: hypothetical protein M1837_000680 [Sclerophora amabilis]|nr:MAG: hypothetical protein M1837_000680 [Sclerophora amabilis]